MVYDLDYSGPKKKPAQRAIPGKPPPPRTVRGHVVDGRNRTAEREAWRRQVEAEEGRKDWLVPLIVLACCAPVWFTFGLWHGGLLGAAGTGGIFAVSVVFNAIIGLVAAYATATLFGASFGPFWTAILKLAAAATVAQTAGLLMPAFMCINLVVYVGVLVIALQMLLDLDGSEAKWFTLFFVIISIAATVGLGAAVEAIFG